jgi:hypothetical protein
MSLPLVLRGIAPDCLHPYGIAELEEDFEALGRTPAT